jgi:hypothetical protein
LSEGTRRISYNVNLNVETVAVGVLASATDADPEGLAFRVAHSFARFSLENQGRLNVINAGDYSKKETGKHKQCG